MDKDRVNILARVLEDAKKIVESGRELPIEFKKILFPSGRNECELVYGGKESKEEIISRVIAVPLQEEKRFPINAKISENDWVNKLIFGDNLQVLKKLIEMKNKGLLVNPDGSYGVKLVYIDPPFSTRKDFKANGKDKKAYADKLAGSDFLEWLRKRLILIRELLTDDGSIYIHLDYRKYHYVKVLMDEIFGENNYRNDIVWKYASNGESKYNYARDKANILFYTKTSNYYFKQKKIFDEVLYARKLIDKDEIIEDENGECMYIYNGERRPFKKQMAEVWLDIPKVKRDGKEICGYPTQKPRRLLERIIEASSKEGEIVMDCFAGSGTTAVVAETLKRKWIAVDVGKYSMYTIQKRLLSLGYDNISPFVLYSAGLYDEKKINEFDEESWKNFALQLWGCKIRETKIKNFVFDGSRHGSLVKVYTPHELKQISAKISLETLQAISTRVGDSAGNNIIIIAPKGQFTFAEDEIRIDNIIFTILRIPYSMLAKYTEGFTAPFQPRDEDTVNDAIESIGFDFIQPPTVDYTITDNELIINDFKSNSRIKGEETSTLSMVLIDYNYDGQTFDLDEVLFSGQDFKDLKAKFDKSKIEKQAMLIFVDDSGNEKKVVIDE